VHFLRITATDPNEQASQYSIETIFGAATGVNNQAHDHKHGAQVLDFDQEEQLMVRACVRVCGSRNSEASCAGLFVCVIGIVFVCIWLRSFNPSYSVSLPLSLSTSSFPRVPFSLFPWFHIFLSFSPHPFLHLCFSLSPPRPDLSYSPASLSL
jgi:hypothetical protein